MTLLLCCLLAGCGPAEDAADALGELFEGGESALDVACEDTCYAELDQDEADELCPDEVDHCFDLCDQHAGDATGSCQSCLLDTIDPPTVTMGEEGVVCQRASVNPDLSCEFNCG